MQAVVIYDNAGNVWNVTYGDSAKPESLGSARLEIPDGAQITGVDLTNPEAPQPVFESIPASDYTNLQNQITDVKGNQQGITETVDEIMETIVENDYRLCLMELGL